MTPRLPNLIIAGLGKAGTTSLFWYLSQHPDICTSQVKEIRFFSAASEGGALPPIEEYAAYFKHCGDRRFVMEASPQYFHGGPPVIEAIRRSLDRPRVVLSLRDPIDRLWSQYRFAKTRMGPLPGSMTFDQYVDRSLQVRREGRPLTPANQPYWHLSGGFYVEHISAWLDAFGDDLRVVFFEQLTVDPATVVVELCRWLEIDGSPASRFTYSVENKTEQFRSRLLQRAALALNSERLLGSRRRLKAPLRRLYYGVNRKPPREHMSDEARRILQREFGPANDELSETLRNRGYTDLPDWLAGRSTAGSNRSS
jgi:Sulfotransferase domain